MVTVHEKLENVENSPFQTFYKKHHRMLFIEIVLHFSDRFIVSAFKKINHAIFLV